MVIRTLAFTLLLSSFAGCGEPPQAAVAHSAEGLPQPGEICTWIANQFVSWDPSVLQQIEGTELPACTGGCGTQPNIYGCNTPECRFYFSRCKKNGVAALLGDLGSWVARIETINGMIAGKDDSGKGTVVHQIAQYLWNALNAACTGWIMNRAAQNPNQIFSVPPNSQQVYGRNLTPAMAQRMCTSWSVIEQAAGYAGVAIQGIQQCLLPAVELFVEIERVLEDQFRYGGGCYGYLNQEWWVEVGRLTCQLVNTLNKCRTTEALSSALASVNTYINTNPILQTLIHGCDTFVTCQQNLLCENIEKACKFQANVAARPYPCMTAAQNYSCDLHCCCRQNDVWSIGPEHQCLVNGGFMRPGTCGVSDPAQRTAWNLPTTPAQCAQFDANPGAWGPVGDPSQRCVANCPACPPPNGTPPTGFTCQAGTCPMLLTTCTPTAMTAARSGRGTGGIHPLATAKACDGMDLGTASGTWSCIPMPCALFADGSPQDCAGCGAGITCTEEYDDDYCGNGVCGEGKTHDNCPQDCPDNSFAYTCDSFDGVCGTFCGDGFCDSGETSSTCPQDCPATPSPDECGDGFCGMSMDSASCPQDCPSIPDLDVCGDDICGATEDNSTCPLDCPMLP